MWRWRLRAHEPTLQHWCGRLVSPHLSPHLSPPCRHALRQCRADIPRQTMTVSYLPRPQPPRSSTTCPQLPCSPHDRQHLSCPLPQGQPCLSSSAASGHRATTDASASLGDQDGGLSGLGGGGDSASLISSGARKGVSASAPLSTMTSWQQLLHSTILTGAEVRGS